VQVHNPRVEFRRVVVIGTSSSGKTSLAARLATLLGAPHIELDAIFWGPDWTKTPREEFRRTVAAAVAAEAWVVDGNYSTVRDIVWERATTAVWLDYPFVVVFARALARTARRVFLREEIFSGNRETIRNGLLSRDSIPWWVVRTFRRRRRFYRDLFAERRYPNVAIVRLRRPREADELIGAFGASVDASDGKNVGT